MTFDALVDALDAAGMAVDLTETGDQLTIAALSGVLTPDLLQAITDHKPALIAALTGFRPLDAAISASEAGRRSVVEIEARLARLTAQAASPNATGLDRQLVADWTAIHRVKLSGEQAA